MKNSNFFKCICLLLATVLLLGTVCSALCIIALIGTDLYSTTVEEAYADSLWSERHVLATNLVHAYASLELGQLPEEYYEQYYGTAWRSHYFPEALYYYAIFDESGSLVESTVTDEIAENLDFYEIEVTNVRYRSLVAEPTVSAASTDPVETGATTPTGAADTGIPEETMAHDVTYDFTLQGYSADTYYDETRDCYVTVYYVVESLDHCTVQLYLMEGAYHYDALWDFLDQLYGIRYDLFWYLGCCLLLFVLVMILLCRAAGRKRGSDTLRPGGLNRLPLDLYTALVALAAVGLTVLGSYLLSQMTEELFRLMLHLLVCDGILLCLTVVALSFAWAAQLKMPDRFWLKNTLIGRVVGLALRCLRRVCRGARELFHQLSLAWQWALIGSCMVLVPVVLMFLWLVFMETWYEGLAALCLILLLLAIPVGIAVAIRGASQFAALRSGAKRMCQGELDAKIPTARLSETYREMAEDLNELSETVALAAERQIRSERMRTELITNVSHDIKTPLTSIINFVDLLQKPHTEAEQAEYLEVLSRQSAQMKKLIEDLMELSKASSGSLTVHLEQVDAVEAVNQALGEFSDKLTAAGLIPVFRQPAQPVYIEADGRHVWRVLSNLLTNAVKYALPGTRLYVDLLRSGRDVILSVKNVSREELNVSADELMERFVQGDASRNTEGSGLGLNIARSLMEVQHGQLQLTLDGDLFKVTLLFRAAEDANS